MYLWRIGNLRAQLGAGPLPQRQALAYYIPFIVLTTLAGIPRARAAPSYTDLLQYAIPAAAGWIFIWRAYIANGGNAGSDFLPRFFALSWVRGIRFIVQVGVPFLLVAIFVLKPLLTYWAGFHSEFVLANQSSLLLSSALIGLAIGISLTIFFFWRPVLGDLRGLHGARAADDQGPSAVTAASRG